MMQELSLNILDIAQNSIRAGATLTEITVEEDEARDRMQITIADNGCGMTPDILARVTDPFCTTRTSRRVGLGVPFMKMACEMTGGDFSIESESGKGTVVHAGLGLRHIDRSPLGDIAMTVSALVQCNPDIDFVYTHHTSSGSFTADTREFRAVLEGIPLSSPEVVSFLHEFIQEHLTDIHGGLV